MGHFFVIEVFLYSVENLDPQAKDAQRSKGGQMWPSGAAPPKFEGNGVAVQFMDYPVFCLGPQKRQEESNELFYCGKRCVFDADMKEMQMLLAQVPLYLMYIEARANGQHSILATGALPLRVHVSGNSPKDGFETANVSLRDPTGKSVGVATVCVRLRLTGHTTSCGSELATQRKPQEIPLGNRERGVAGQEGYTTNATFPERGQCTHNGCPGCFRVPTTPLQSRRKLIQSTKGNKKNQPEKGNASQRLAASLTPMHPHNLGRSSFGSNPKASPRKKSVNFRKAARKSRRPPKRVKAPSENAREYKDHKRPLIKVNCQVASDPTSAQEVDHRCQRCRGCGCCSLSPSSLGCDSGGQYSTPPPIKSTRHGGHLDHVAVGETLAEDEQNTNVTEPTDGEELNVSKAASPGGQNSSRPSKGPKLGNARKQNRSPDLGANVCERSQIAGGFSLCSAVTWELINLISLRTVLSQAVGAMGNQMTLFANQTMQQLASGLLTEHNGQPSAVATLATVLSQQMQSATNHPLPHLPTQKDDKVECGQQKEQQAVQCVAVNEKEVAESHEGADNLGDCLTKTSPLSEKQTKTSPSRVPPCIKVDYPIVSSPRSRSPSPRARMGIRDGREWRRIVDNSQGEDSSSGAVGEATLQDGMGLPTLPTVDERDENAEADRSEDSSLVTEIYEEDFDFSPESPKKDETSKEEQNTKVITLRTSGGAVLSTIHSERYEDDFEFDSEYSPQSNDAQVMHQNMAEENTKRAEETAVNTLSIPEGSGNGPGTEQSPGHHRYTSSSVASTGSSGFFSPANSLDISDLLADDDFRAGQRFKGSLAKTH